ncbi:hypothetical protein BJI67_14050 [Acidihalobacter aeolianus]|uniref:YecA family protein n=1 Tax=Acidihalobacter aeolianus TaxID=2792603 RepID=A0A1D8KAT4_9GAMM|nr:UPF0149 family protein [Acidihalobacter aeolianus]AOV18036.1 hypothetical protein BJI67_14050 [Acidihalobacter aeolianus]
MDLHFESLDEELRGAGAAMGAAEGHGLLCARLALGTLGDEESWLQETLGSSADASVPCRQGLSELYRNTRLQLDDAEISFQPFLPGDEAELNERVAALGQWCYGFSTGLVLAGLQAERLEALPEQVREFIDDLGRIAQVSSDSVAYEEGEADYAELLEYVRIGVLLLFEEMQPRTPLSGLH